MPLATVISSTTLRKCPTKFPRSAGSVFDSHDVVNEADLAEAVRRIEQHASEISLENIYSLATMAVVGDKEEVPTC
jgi:hypothetical protein